jgi:hypothetical protein
MANMINLNDCGPALTVDEINAFGEEIGGCLPDDYKRFLLNTNGGLANPSLGFKWNGKLNEIHIFDALLATSENGLRRGLRNLREVGVDGFLPVAGALNGEDICIPFLDNTGKILLALYEYDNDVPVGATMVPLTNSFTELLSRLVVIPKVYCRIEELGEHGTPDDLAQHMAAGNSIDAVGKHDFTVICEAIRFHNLPMIEACIQQGASLSGTIELAVGNGYLNLVKRLVEVGADINEQNEYGRRPLRHVPGTAVPGEEGARNRAMKALLISLGAIE